MSTISGAFGFLERLVTDFTARRLIVFISALLVVGGSVAVFEAYTGHFRLQKLEKMASITKELSDSQDNAVNEKVVEVERSISDELSFLLNSNISPLRLPEWSIKAGAATAPWLIVLLIMLISNKGQAIEMTVGIALLATPFIIIGVILPDFEASWINHFVYPILSCLIAVMIVAAYGNRKG